MSKRLPDYLNSPGDSHALAMRIGDYWRSRGYRGVKTQVLNTGCDEFPVWSIRSNMVDGFPPREEVVA